MARSGNMAATWLRILCVFALVMLSFAHRPPQAIAAQPTPVELASLTLPDGTVPVICSSDEDGKAKPHAHLSTPCEACRLSAAVLLSEPAEQIGLSVPFTEKTVYTGKAQAFYRQIVPPNANPRAPPAFA